MNKKQIFNIGIIVLFILALVIFLRGTKPIDKAPAYGQNTTSTETISTDDHVLGDRNADIIIIEYSDTECPFCKVFHNTMHEVIEEYNNVAWVFRHYPIATLHPRAFHEAEAIECAFDQGGDGAFWNYTDKLFEVTPSNNGLSVEELPKIAEQVGLDVALFKTCLASGKFGNKIQAHIDQGVKDGARGTPFSIIITKKAMSAKTQNDIFEALNSPGAVSFDPTNKKKMSMNGALPVEMVRKILDILSR